MRASRRLTGDLACLTFIMVSRMHCMPSRFYLMAGIGILGAFLLFRDGMFGFQERDTALTLAHSSLFPSIIPRCGMDRSVQAQ